MKPISSFLLAAFIFPVFAFAQDCDAFLPFQEGTKLTYTFYDKKEKEAGSSTQYVKEVQNLADGGLKALFEMEMRDKKGKEAMTSTFEVTCRDNAIHMRVSDMLMPEMTEAFQSMEVSVEGDALELPHDLEVGQMLPDASSVITPNMNGMNLMKFTYAVTDRKVEAKEEVTTPAGTFDCYKLTSTFQTKAMGSREFTQVQWFAKGVGMVKAETYDKKGRLDGRQLLTALER